MLALFDESSTLTDDLRVEFPNLTTEKCQLPLAMIPMSEEEQRLWSRNVNSDAVIRLQGKDRGAPGMGLPNVDRLGERRDLGIRRGVSIPDRGGRGRLSSARPGFYSKGSYEDREDDDRFGKPFARSNSTSDDKFERSFPRDEDRRKDARSELSWRTTPAKNSDERGSWRTRGKEEGGGGGWRSGGSWRDSRDDDNYHNGPRHRSSHSFSRDWDDDDDRGQNLPEWSLDDDNGATVGSFDASGAFREGSDDDSKNDDEGEW